MQHVLPGVMEVKLRVDENLHMQHVLPGCDGGEATRK